MREWWNTPAAAWGFLIVGIGAGTVLAYLSQKIGIPICVVLILIGIWLIIRSYRNRNRLSKIRIITYTREQLMQGAIVYVPPAAALGIPLTVEKGEVIGQIEISPLEVHGATENYIDSVLLDSNGKEVFSFSGRRELSRNFGGAIPTGKYTLRLSNEYQPSFEKHLQVTICWKPSSEIKPTIINGKSIIPQAEISLRISPSTSSKEGLASVDGHEPKVEVKKEVHLELVKLLHEGKDIQAKLKNVQAQWSSFEQVGAEVEFEAWSMHVSNTLENTEFRKLWYENKVVNYRKDSISDYIGVSERALDRLESIMQLIADKGGSQN